MRNACALRLQRISQNENSGTVHTTGHGSCIFPQFVCFGTKRAFVCNFHLPAEALVEAANAGLLKDRHRCLADGRVKSSLRMHSDIREVEKRWSKRTNKTKAFLYHTVGGFSSSP